MPVSIENERSVCDCMIDGVKEALLAYPTSASDDEAVLRSDLSYRYTPKTNKCC